jgi:cysteine desulfurase
MHEMLTDLWGNPSSAHRFGQAARQKLDLARQQIADLIGGKPRELIFTAGGTESANLAVQGMLQTSEAKQPVVITTRIEHSAVREQVETLAERGVIRAAWLESEDGLIQPDLLASAFDANPDAAIVSIQWANNETGLIQPIAELGALCEDRDVPLHVDGTQWVGKMPTDLAAPDGPHIDLLTFSAHKFHGPKGVGCLWIRRGWGVRPVTLGGPQENQRRPGTENTAGIVGMGVAAQLAKEWLATDGIDRQRALRDAFEAKVLERCEGVRVNSGERERLWSTSNIAFPGLEAEAILIGLSERGVYASAGAACSSGSLEPSPVLRAMGLDEAAAHGSVRFSLSRETAPEDVDEAVEVLAAVVQRLRG